MKKTRVLIVDDEEDAIAALQFRLAAAGYEVVTASNGAEALDVIQTSDVDLVLADFMMPEINGLELTRLVKSDPKLFEVKILLFSCNTEPEFRRRAIELGAIDYLAKTDGANSIVSRVYDVVSPEKPTAGQDDPVSAESDREAALRFQVRALAQNLTDVLHLAQMEKDVPRSTQYAIDSANRIAEDMLNLADAVQELGTGVRPAEQRLSTSIPSSTR